MHQVAGDKPLHTFTAGYGPENPKMIGAGEVARHFGTIHHEILMPPEQLVDICRGWSGTWRTRSATRRPLTST